MAALAQLPQEVWLLVLSFLEPKDRAHIRASCQFFRRLADHPCLWRKHTVLLKEGRSFNRGLWRTLRRRRPGAIVIQKATIRALESMSTQLPWLASLTIEHPTPCVAGLGSGSPRPRMGQAVQMVCVFASIFDI
uniref:F-box domain-containing protein n=1 Tax=Scleropages formosus TaxID=113540 RepID=A0A8C9WGL0_SCLFO